MPAPAVSAPPKRFFRSCRRDNSGSAAVEFSLVAVPFFALLFAVIETGMVFFAGEVLEAAVQDTSRLVYTNQMTNKNTTRDQFMDNLCPRVSVLMRCATGIDSTGVGVDVQYYPPDSPIAITDPIDGSGSYDNSKFAFVLPPQGSTGTVVVRAFYQWPLFVTGLGYNIANIGRGSSNSKRLLAATAAFHIEPPP